MFISSTDSNLIFENEGNFPSNFGLTSVSSRKNHERLVVVNTATIKRNVSEFPSSKSNVVWIADREAIYDPTEVKKKSAIIDRELTSDSESSSEFSESSDESYAR